MRKTLLALFAGAAILASASAYAQSVTPTEGLYPCGIRLLTARAS
jgi:hypothetical protein